MREFVRTAGIALVFALMLVGAKGLYAGSG